MVINVNINNIDINNIDNINDINIIMYLWQYKIWICGIFLNSKFWCNTPYKFGFHPYSNYDDNKGYTASYGIFVEVCFIWSTPADYLVKSGQRQI